MFENDSEPQKIEIDWPPVATGRTGRRKGYVRPARPPRSLLHTAQLVVGRTFLSSGLLLFAFVAYQLWGTQLQEARAQDGLSGKFQQVLAGAARPGPVTTTTVTTTVAAVTTTDPSTVATTGSVPGSAVSTASPPVTADPGPPPAAGDPIARLVIPKIGVDKIVVSGVTVDALRKGPGHFPDTPMPGERGNASIAGHRTTFGAPFNRVDELATGDAIQVTTVGGTFVYLVTGQQIVGPDRYDVVGPTDTPVLTLISCDPKLSATNRIVISAALDPTASSSVTEPSPTRAPSGTGTLPGDEPDGSSPTAAGSTGGNGGATSGSGGAPATVTGGDVGSEGVTGAGAASATSQAFQQTWFSDQLAWADVAIWGGILSGLSLLAWQLSRRTRNLVGGLVGVVPFVVVLYFFFENVSRLLPPNL